MRQSALVAIVLMSLLAFSALLWGRRASVGPEKSTAHQADGQDRRPLRGPRLSPSALNRMNEATEAATTTASLDAGDERSSGPTEEEILTERIRSNVALNPPLAEMAAREARERFPQSPASDERDMGLVLALFNQQKIDLARQEAYYYFIRHPNGRYTKDLEKLTSINVHPR
jgi:hypothetical protein